MAEKHLGYLLKADSDYTTSVFVQLLEALSQRAQHHTALDEVIKLHGPLVAPVKHLSTQLAEINRTEQRSEEGT